MSKSVSETKLPIVFGVTIDKQYSPARSFVLSRPKNLYQAGMGAVEAWAYLSCLSKVPSTIESGDHLSPCLFMFCGPT